ncbi:unnamed protein product [Trichogramma brassicae]|uniref:Uncharacterized protein n=1 Tax=Trichogramma brassicae TaxID=86971 RepID=A0A6H5J8V8_9HYME|nr:unnamed protein product [Trichogramma brassicae]
MARKGEVRRISKGITAEANKRKQQHTQREQFPALPLTPSEGCSKGQWRESTVASEGGILKLMHRSKEREHEKYCQEAKINKAQLAREPTTRSRDGSERPMFTGGVTTTLGRLDVQVHINGKTERMQWRAMSYLDHDIILGADFKNLWAVDTQTVEGEWRVHKGSWMPFYREGTNSEADILVECASLAIASAAEQACIKALLDRVLGEHDDSEAESLECAGLSEITPEQETAIRVVVDRMMTAEPGTLGLTRLTEHHIDVQGASPIKHKMRRMSPPMLQVAHDEVKKMLAEGVIEPSASSWSSAPVIVKKADGSNRFCIDYRDLNKVTKKDAYPVQNIDAILDKLRRARYITTIDLKSAYFQIAMEESSKKVRARRRWPARRQGQGRTGDELPGAHRLEELTTFLRYAWLVRQVHTERRGDEVASPQVHEKERRMDLGRRTTTSVRSSEDSSDGSARACTTRLREAVYRPVRRVCARDWWRALASLRRRRAPNRICEPRTYISGAQLHDQREGVPRTPMDDRKLRPYLEGYKFIAVTDHSALQYLRNLKDPTGRLAQWALEMQQWEFEIVHRRGKVHELPDALSRAYETNEEVCVAGVSDESDEEHRRLVEDVTQNPQRWQNWRVEGGNLYHYRYDPLLDPITDCEKVGNWSYRQRKERESCATLTISRAPVISASRRPSIASSGSITGAACITTCTNTFARVIRASAIRSIRLVRVDLWGRRVIERPWSVIACDLMGISAQQKPKQLRRGEWCICECLVHRVAARIECALLAILPAHPGPLRPKRRHRQSGPPRLRPRPTEERDREGGQRSAKSSARTGDEVVPPVRSRTSSGSI